MYEKLLEYQKLDGKLLNLERSLEKDPAKQSLNKIGAQIKDSQNKLLDLEAKAKSTVGEYEKCKALYDNCFEELEKLTKQDMSTMSEEVLNENQEKLSKLVNSLGALERNLSSQAGLVDEVVKNFEVCKNNIVRYRQLYKEGKVKCEGIEKQYSAQMEEIKKQMLDMEKDIDQNMLSKYKHLRQDKIFPVLVPLNHNSCGGCSMELPAALMNKLKEHGHLECEQCRRYIYIS